MSALRLLKRLAPRPLKRLWHLLRQRFGTGRKVYIVNHHRRIICCAMRDDDLLRMAAYLRANGFMAVDRPGWADLLLINTCAFDKEREKYSIELIREFSIYRGKLIVTGCVGRINENALREVFKGPYIPPTELNSALDAAVDNIQRPFQSLALHGQEAQLYDGGLGWRSHTRPTDVPRAGAVKIVNGCPQRCAYCTHRMAIGQEPVSVPMERILESIKAQARDGARVIQLLGDNLGPYGRDIGSHVPALVTDLAQRFPGIRYALDQYHPAYFIQDYPRGLREAVAGGLIYEIKMPIQSGCPRILHAMQRPTNLETLAEYLQESARLDPRILFVTHIITGFPSETEAEFHESTEYVRRVFGHNALVFIFPCSVHPDTPAARIEPKVPAEEAMRRALEAERIFRRAGIDVCVDHLEVLRARGHVATD